MDVDHAAREGASKYSPLRLLRLGLHVVVGFGRSRSSGSASRSASCARSWRPRSGSTAIVFWIDNSNFPGPLFLGVLVLYVLAMQGFVLALVGEYLSRIQRDVEGRPLYIVEKEL